MRSPSDGPESEIDVGPQPSAQFLERLETFNLQGRDLRSQQLDQPGLDDLDAAQFPASASNSLKLTEGLNTMTTEQYPNVGIDSDRILSNVQDLGSVELHAEVSGTVEVKPKDAAESKTGKVNLSEIVKQGATLD